jgi:predicted Co/Zn/Cd cation transporter (cation efflux family)
MPCVRTVAGGREVTLVQGEIVQVAAVAVVAAVWFAADGYSRRMRRQANRSRVHQVRTVVERGEVIDAHALSASDD